MGTDMVCLVVVGARHAVPLHFTLYIRLEGRYFLTCCLLTPTVEYAPITQVHQRYDFAVMLTNPMITPQTIVNTPF